MSRVAARAATDAVAQARGHADKVFATVAERIAVVTAERAAQDAAAKASSQLDRLGEQLLSAYEELFQKLHLPSSTTTPAVHGDAPLHRTNYMERTMVPSPHQPNVEAPLPESPKGRGPLVAASYAGSGFEGRDRVITVGTGTHSEEFAERISGDYVNKPDRDTDYACGGLSPDRVSTARSHERSLRSSHPASGVLAHSSSSLSHPSGVVHNGFATPSGGAARQPEGVHNGFLRRRPPPLAATPETSLSAADFQIEMSVDPLLAAQGGTNCQQANRFRFGQGPGPCLMRQLVEVQKQVMEL